MSENLSYCDNDICDEYSNITINKKNYCNKCCLEYIQIIQSTIKMKHIKSLFNNSNIKSTVHLHENNKLIKYIIKNGIDNNTPKKGYIATIIYRGFLLNGKQVDSSKNKPFNITIGINNIIPMWDKVLMSMTKGEECIFIGDSSLGYGKEPPFNTIPPNSDLCFHVKLLNFESDSEQFDIENMSYNDKIHNMQKYKDIALNYYKKNDINNAIVNFHKSLDFIYNDDINEEGKDIKNNKINLLNNLSLCYFKIKKYNESSSFSFQVLEIDYNNIKATYRHALNLIEMEEYDTAILGLEKLVNLHPNEYNIQLLNNIKQKNKNILLQKKNTYKKMFT